MKLNKKIAVLFSALLVLSGVLLIPLQKLPLGYQMGNDTDVIYEVKSMGDDSFNISDIAKILSKRARYFGTTQYELSVLDDHHIGLSVPTGNAVLARATVSESVNFEVRDADDNLLLGADDLKNVSVITDDNTVYLSFSFKDPEKVASVVDGVKNSETLSSKYLVFWLDFASAGTTYAAEGDKLKADSSYEPAYLSAENVASVAQDDNTFKISGIYNYAYSKRLAGLINAGSAAVTFTEVSADVSGTSLALTLNRNLIFIGIALTVVLVSVYFWLVYRDAGLIVGVIGLFATYLTLFQFYLVDGILSFGALLALLTTLASYFLFAQFALKQTKRFAKAGRPYEQAVVSAFNQTTMAVVYASLVLAMISIGLYYINLHYLRDIAMIFLVALPFFLVAYFLLRFGLRQLARTYYLDRDVSFINLKKFDMDEQSVQRYEALNIQKRFPQMLVVMLVLLIPFVISVSIGKINLNETGTTHDLLVISSTESDVYLKAQSVLADNEISPSDYRTQTGSATTRFVFSSTSKNIELTQLRSTLQDKIGVDVALYQPKVISADHVAVSLAMITLVVLVVSFVMVLIRYGLNFARTIVAVEVASIVEFVVIGAVLAGALTPTLYVVAFSALNLLLFYSIFIFQQIRDRTKDLKRVPDVQTYGSLMKQVYGLNMSQLLINGLILAVLMLTLLLVNIRFSGGVFALSLLMAFLAVLMVLFLEPNLLLIRPSVPGNKTPKQTKKKETPVLKEKEELPVVGLND